MSFKIRDRVKFINDAIEFYKHEQEPYNLKINRFYAVADEIPEELIVHGGTILDSKYYTEGALIVNKYCVNSTIYYLVEYDSNLGKTTLGFKTSQLELFDSIEYCKNITNNDTNAKDIYKLLKESVDKSL